MKNKSNYIILIFVLLWISNTAYTQTNAKSKVSNDRCVETKHFHYGQQSSDSSYYYANINYFQILGESNLANVVNNIVLEVYLGTAEGIPENPNICIKAYFDGLNKEIEDMIQEFGDVEAIPYTYDYSTSVVLNEYLLFTFKQIFYEYSGGAHGNGGESYYNFDAKTGDKLELNNLFSQKELDSLIILGEQVFRTAQEIPTNKTLEEWGYEFEKGFYLSTNFLITDSSIIFYYSPYEIACYAMGDSRFELSFDILKTMCPNAKLFEYLQ